MKTIIATEKMYHYLDCPYCDAFMSDESDSSFEDVEKCVSCGKTFKVKI